LKHTARARVSLPAGNTPFGAGSRDEELRRLHVAQRISRVGSWNYELTGPALTVSDMLLELYGLQRNAFTGAYDVLNDCVHPVDRPSVSAGTKDLTETGVAMTIRYRVIRAMAHCVGSTRAVSPNGTRPA
jgi:hypothetical protein